MLAQNRLFSKSILKKIEKENRALSCTPVSMASGVPGFVGTQARHLTRIEAQGITRRFVSGTMKPDYPVVMLISTQSL